MTGLFHPFWEWVSTIALAYLGGTILVGAMRGILSHLGYGDKK